MELLFALQVGPIARWWCCSWWLVLHFKGSSPLPVPKQAALPLHTQVHVFMSLYMSLLQCFCTHSAREHLHMNSVVLCVQCVMPQLGAHAYAQMSALLRGVQCKGCCAATACRQASIHVVISNLLHDDVTQDVHLGSYTSQPSDPISCWGVKHQSYWV